MMARTPVNWSNPYADRKGRWLRGNLHTHTSPASQCGQVSLPRMVELYAGAGYDFMAISDHMALTPAEDARLALIPGIEWNDPAGGKHLGAYAADLDAIAAQIAASALDDVLRAFDGTDGLAILNHPSWQLTPHYRREELLALPCYDGIEIFNGIIKRLEGYEIATDKWDYLLARGRRVLGFASDDSHIEADVGVGWVMARAASRRPDDILAALKAGNFYCSSGVELLDIRREGETIELETADGQEIQVIVDGGAVRRTARDRGLTLTAEELDAAYVRFAVYGAGSSMAWTQPFFLREGTPLSKWTRGKGL